MVPADIEPLCDLRLVECTEFIRADALRVSRKQELKAMREAKKEKGARKLTAVPSSAASGFVTAKNLADSMKKPSLQDLVDLTEPFQLDKVGKLDEVDLTINAGIQLSSTHKKRSRHNIDSFANSDNDLDIGNYRSMSASTAVPRKVSDAEEGIFHPCRSLCSTEPCQTQKCLRQIMGGCSVVITKIICRLENQ